MKEEDMRGILIPINTLLNLCNNFDKAVTMMSYGPDNEIALDRYLGVVNSILDLKIFLASLYDLDGREIGIRDVDSGLNKLLKYMQDSIEEKENI